VPGAPGDIVINIPADKASDKKAAETQKAKENGNGKKEKESKKPKEAGGFFGKKKDALSEEIPAAESMSQPAQETVIRPETPVYAPPVDYGDETQSFVDAPGATRFRLVGSMLLPPVIDVRISEGEIFTIGRFDAAAGRKQSSFEFDKNTKAVSRRHAAVERDCDGYSVIDLASSAGTFVNGQKLPPNTPFKLSHGCRVSFGNAGAEYVWET